MTYGIDLLNACILPFYDTVARLDINNRTITYYKSRINYELNVPYKLEYQIEKILKNMDPKCYFRTYLQNLLDSNNIVDEYLKKSHRIAFSYKSSNNESKEKWISLEFVKDIDYNKINNSLLILDKEVSNPYVCSIFEKNQNINLYYDVLSDTVAANKNYIDTLLANTEIKKNYGMIYCHINGLEKINKKYGYHIGNEVIKNLANNLNQHFSKHEIYKISGDEFFVLANGLTELEFSEKIHDLMKIYYNQNIQVTIVGSHHPEAQPFNIVFKEVLEASKSSLISDKAFLINNQKITDSFVVNGKEVVQSYFANIFNHVEDNTEVNTIDEIFSKIFDVFAASNHKNFFYIMDMKSSLIMWSQEAIEKLGLRKKISTFKDCGYTELIHPNDRDLFIEDISEIINGQKDYHCLQYRIKSTTGEYILVTCRGWVIRTSNGEPLYFAGSVENQDSQDEVDDETNIFNLHKYKDVLRTFISKKQNFGTMRISLDNLLKLNIMYGFEYSSKLLRGFIQEIKEALGTENYMFFRVDGYCITIISTNTNRQHWIDIFNKIRQISRSGIKLDADLMQLKTSYSCVIADNDNYDSVSKIRGALIYAQEMSATKKHGDLVFFNDIFNNRGEIKLDVIGVIHQCINNHCEGFYLCYQPVVSVETNKIVGAESLIRWKHPKFGIIPPNQFIPWLEDDPCFYTIGLWIIKQSITDALNFKKLVPNFFININITAPQLENPNFRYDVIQIISDLKYPTKDLVFELTERCHNMDYNYLKEIMNFFRSRGIKIALDDFGTGSSSMQVLSQLPIDEIKIDMSFIKDIKNKVENQNIVKFTTDYAQKMGQITCIEGVEDKDIAEYLKHFGSTFYQGYFYSKPVEYDEFTRILHEINKV
ncbi:MAG: EAL domain-containing protein [Succinivibrionaceae bacterium]